MDLKAARLELGMTQAELSAVVYLTTRQLSKIESGRSATPKLVEEKIVMLLANSATQKSATEN